MNYNDKQNERKHRLLKLHDQGIIHIDPDRRVISLTDKGMKQAMEKFTKAIQQIKR
jgi:Mn-dependent DtxR family transcriptional regulator